MNSPWLQAFIDAGDLSGESIERFLERETIPHVDENSVTFLFYGAAENVLLRNWIFGLPSSQPFEQVNNTGLWHLTIDIPQGSRFEYKIERVNGAGRELMLDPHNPSLARDPFGANSVCQAHGYEVPDWSLPDPEARPGIVRAAQFRSEILGRTQRAEIYLPQRFRRRRRYPLLIVHDGPEYVRFASLKTVLDNLIHRLEIPPLIAVLIQSRDRLREYAADPRHARFLAEELLPQIEQRFPIDPDPVSRALMGASFGAVAALSTAWRYPGTFGSLLLQSGSFAFTDIGESDRGPLFDPVVEFINEFRRRPGRPTERVFMSCGMYESLIYENRSLVPRIQALGIDLRYRESRDGHNWENWRDHLREGLSWLFPGPLWMVYE